MWRPEHNALLDSRMVGRSLDAHNECSAPALMEETPKALRVAVVEDDPRIQQLIKTLRSRGWNEHPDQREPSQQRKRRFHLQILWMGRQIRANGARFRSLNPDATEAHHRFPGH